VRMPEAGGLDDSVRIRSFSSDTSSRGSSIQPPNHSPELGQAEVLLAVPVAPRLHKEQTAHQVGGAHNRQAI
jgi:hypothetical protein